MVPCYLSLQYKLRCSISTHYTRLANKLTGLDCKYSVFFNFPLMPQTIWGFFVGFAVLVIFVKWPFK